MTGRTPRHLALVGPTASGKTALSLAIAGALGDVEIVSLDSMQVYRGMDIGTAKPCIEERRAVVHHLIDVADPHEEWSVARTQQLARDAVRDIEARGRRALLVGGTGLYVQAVVDDLSLPNEDLALRAELDAATSQPGGLLAAYRELEALDPVAAARIDEHNQRRIVRALEVIRSTGKPFSSFGPGLDRYGPTAFSVALFGIWMPRAVLGERIKRRFATMLADGLVDEVQRLWRNGAPSRSAAQAIGYKEVAAALDAGADVTEALALAERRTRSFARRQRMWFRRDPRIVWFATAGKPEALLPAFLATWTAERGAPGASSSPIATASV